MKITWAFPAYARQVLGGYNVHYEYASRMAARGHQVTLVFPRSLDDQVGPLKAQAWAARMRLENHPLIRGFSLHPRVEVRLVGDLSPASLPDADVLVATAWRTAEAMKTAPDRCGRKHYIVYDYEHWLGAECAVKARISATFRAGFKMLATSSAVSEMIRQSGGREGATAHCGINRDVFGLDAPIAGRTPTTVMFAARQESVKRLSVALSALSLVRARHGPGLRVIGFGQPSLIMPDWVEYHTRPPNSRLRTLYNETAVFLCASYAEGWGLPSVEAMSCGAALATTDNGGSRDFARDGDTALVVPPEDARALADAISRLIEQPELRCAIAQRGRDWVGQYDWERSADIVESFLRD